MSPTSTVERAILHKQAWKSPVLDHYVTGLLLAALRLLVDHGILFFNNDDVPEPFQPGDGTTVGAAIKLLLLENIIEPYRGTIEALCIYGGTRRSSRRENHGHRNQLYALTNTGIAREWLARHGAETPTIQGELEL